MRSLQRLSRVAMRKVLTVILGLASAAGGYWVGHGSRTRSVFDFAHDGRGSRPLRRPLTLRWNPPTESSSGKKMT